MHHVSTLRHQSIIRLFRQAMASCDTPRDDGDGFDEAVGDPNSDVCAFTSSSDESDTATTTDASSPADRYSGLPAWLVKYLSSVVKF